MSNIIYDRFKRPKSPFANKPIFAKMFNESGAMPGCATPEEPKPLLIVESLCGLKIGKSQYFRKRENFEKLIYAKDMPSEFKKVGVVVDDKEYFPGKMTYEEMVMNEFLKLTDAAMDKLGGWRKIHDGKTTEEIRDFVIAAKLWPTWADAQEKYNYNLNLVRAYLASQSIGRTIQ